MLGARQGITNSLPYARRVEYLESTGTQWIDTGITPNNQFQVFCDGDFTAGTENPTYCGARSSTSRMFEMLCDVAKFCAQFGSASKRADNAINSRHTYLLGRAEFYLDGTKALSFTASTFSVAVPLTIFALNNNGTIARKSIAKIYNLKIYDDNSALVRDFIPVIDFDGIACMFDKVSHSLYYNAGTGTFLTP